MVGMATVGTLSYNGVDFDGSSKVTVQVDPVKDESGRTVLYHRHTLNVSATIADNDSTDGDMRLIRQRLGEQGAELIFINRGFGDDLIVNSPGGTVRDVKWGPIPEVISWKPIGSLRACEIEWRVTTCVPVCSSTSGMYSGIITINYDMAWSISEKGYTTRTITGYLEIAMTRSGRSAPDTADRYRDKITPTVPTRFKRSQSWTLSKDKSRLDFSIVDKEVELSLIHI